ncbi:MAG: nitrous oxide reductase accessory protein NosL [Gemmatimonadetes bacterium]|nr:nitrous oxide reductase accessory protein NosL [Gemmatimonadota bacterium]MBP6669348.1 nitrous oxide reductase accessory protein NosL [Gemmatimonadales bacterium]MBK7349248.1 nitrous oxide reductase accessory protein NosL [Gemmatimonadota bacterium]MBK7714815.1 nitrous oxide reductase accessory protein NosL [Gemmatimonadota bacterium]MBK7783876.1 nitrous oxide reductase accessory protein NosL [Gemmatimonadota bacterium]
MRTWPGSWRAGVPGGVLLALLVVACAPRGPRPLALGREPCAHCHMTIMQERFTAQAILPTGKSFVFDDVGCLASWLAASPDVPASVWVWSAVPGEGWLPAADAVYIHSDSLRTPMGGNLAAARPGTGADSLRAALGGALRAWAEIRNTRPPPPAS